MIVGFCTLLFFSLKPVSNILAYALENQYQPPSKEVISTIDKVVILGGGVLPSTVFRKNPEASGATYSRLFNGVRIFKQSNAKMLVLSGAGEEEDNESNAEIMERLATELGVPEDAIIKETKSHNTFEHAIKFAKLFPKTDNMKIGIVTSAIHMPRAVQAFRKKVSQDAIIPIPVGYIYSPFEYNIESFIPSSDAFSTSSYAIHEWIGIVWHHFRNWGI